MVSESEFIEFAAEIFEVPAASLSLESSYGTFPQWDSIAHLRLVMEIATRYGTDIPFADVTSIRSLWEFWRRVNGLSPKKIIALDLDNTLWDGIVGESDDIRPKTGFLTQLKALKERGVLLAVLSKNNVEDGLSGIARLGVLNEDDFVSWRIDWNSKADNLQSIADELNLGCDAFVFVDDNPAERMEMRLRHPEVAVSAFPSDLSAYFPERELTDEDRTKTEQYKAEARRRELFGSLPKEDVTPDRLFDLLGVELDIHELREQEVPRVAQLSQKTNQFNVLTNRRTESEIRALARQGLVVTFSAKDRFGDHGLIGFVILRFEQSDAVIEDWAMSCRVMGRGIESRVETEIENALRSRDFTHLTAVWRDSGKNEPVRDLFDRFGFVQTSAAPRERHYRKSL